MTGADASAHPARHRAEHSQRYSTSLPAVDTSRMSAAISAGIGGISSGVTPVDGDQTRFTCSEASVSGKSLRLWHPAAGVATRSGAE